MYYRCKRNTRLYLNTKERMSMPPYPLALRMSVATTALLKLGFVWKRKQSHQRISVASHQVVTSSGRSWTYDLNLNTSRKYEITAQAINVTHPNQAVGKPVTLEPGLTYPSATIP